MLTTGQVLFVALVSAIKIALYWSLLRGVVLDAIGIGPRLGQMSVYAAGFAVFDLWMSPLADSTGFLFSLALASVLGADIVRESYRDGGIGPARLWASDWATIWIARWQVDRIDRLAPEPQWSPLRREIRIMAWDQLPALLFERRELDKQVRILRKRKSYPTNLPDGSLRKQFADRAQESQTRINALQSANTERREEIDDLLEALPSEIYLARREEGEASAVLKRCRSVIQAIDDHRRAREEIEARPAVPELDCKDVPPGDPPRQTELPPTDRS